MVRAVTQAAVVGVHFGFSLAQLAAVVVSFHQMGPHVRPEVCVVDDVTICVYVEGWF